MWQIMLLLTTLHWPQDSGLGREVELISEPGWCFFEIGTADTVALTVEYPVNYNG